MTPPVTLMPRVFEPLARRDLSCFRARPGNFSRSRTPGFTGFYFCHSEASASWSPMLHTRQSHQRGSVLTCGCGLFFSQHAINSAFLEGPCDNVLIGGVTYFSFMSELDSIRFVLHISYHCSGRDSQDQCCVFYDFLLYFVCSCFMCVRACMHVCVLTLAPCSSAPVIAVPALIGLTCV